MQSSFALTSQVFPSPPPQQYYACISRGTKDLSDPNICQTLEATPQSCRGIKVHPVCVAQGLINLSLNVTLLTLLVFRFTWLFQVRVLSSVTLRVMAWSIYDAWSPLLLMFMVVVFNSLNNLNICKLSAYSSLSVWFLSRCSIRLLIHRQKRGEPKTEPCGIFSLMSQYEEDDVLEETRWNTVVWPKLLKHWSWILSPLVSWWVLMIKLYQTPR